MPYTATREVRYTSDASALFYALATPQNSLLLESADIESKKNLTCIAITKAALKVVCRGQEATATALTPSGHLLIDELRADFQSRIIHSSEGSVTFRFALPTEHDERARRRAPSPAATLRPLPPGPLYSGESLPFLGGGFAFDYVATFEELPPVPDGPNVYPDYEFLVAEHVLTVDHLTKRANIEGWGVDKRALEAELDRAAATEPITPEAPAPRETISARASIDDAAFRRHVERLQDNVHAGDIYQVVPSRAFSLDCPDAFAAYRTLRETNPSPYMFYLRGTEHELFGASPESNLKYTASDRQVQVYPVAGTRPRGATHELDIRNELEMRTDSKEVSEHIMLVDLARNDLARVAVPGTRKVADLLQLDRYSRVMHLVSRVVATLHEDFDALDAYRACMNMGTLTGAPKLRAMELIRETEGTRRGSFGGAIGYLRGDGSMDNCIVIRSAYVKDGTAVVQAGAGIVRDSVPQSEADETVHKAYAVLSAIAQAHNASLEVIR